MRSTPENTLDTASGISAAPPGMCVSEIRPIRTITS